jgi:glyceraldehyde-3-phosphate dehydrogenase (NAD(P))
MKVFINGYGTIGKRIADAVQLQKDMEILGVAKTRPDFGAEMALRYDYSLYTEKKNISLFKEKGFDAKDITEGMKASDIIIDCTPKKIGAENKHKYEKLQKKAIFQGGEKSDIGTSFVAQCNYEKAWGVDYVRSVSCNTTGLSRTLGAIQKHINRVTAVMIRRAADPHDAKKGPINAIIPVTRVPSHHGPDVKTVLDIDIETLAVAVPTTLMHLHTVIVDLKDKISTDDVLDIFRNTTRVMLVNSEMGITSTAKIHELARDMGRKRNDMYEICVWEDSVNVKNDTLYYIQAVHQESDVVPENIDAVRAMNKIAEMEESIKITNKTLKIR